MKLSEIERITRAKPGDGPQLPPVEKRRRLAEIGYDTENIYQEIEMDSPYVNTHIDIGSPGENINLHSHTFYELLSVRRGRLQYLLGTERYRVQRGDIIIIPPGISHRPLLDERMAEPFERDVLWISTLFYDEFCCGKDGFLPAFTSPHLLRTAGTQYEYLAKQFSFGVQEAQDCGSLWQQIVIANTLLLTAQIARALYNVEAPPIMPETHELIDDAILYVEDHLADRITLENTARHFLVSQSTISQTFRSKLNVSFYHYVTQRRLIAAKELILADEPLESTAAAVGFADYSTFYRAFKREYGISPLQFRKTQSGGR